MSDNEPQTTTPATARSWTGQRWLFPLAITLFLIGHLGLVFYFEKPSLILSNTPIAWLDYDTHVAQNWRVTESLARFGKAWSYDVQLLAGYPNGTIFDADNKGWELWTYALASLGLSRGLAHNLFILLMHLMVPWVVFAAARLFRVGRWTSLLAALFAVLLWFFDGYPHWCWWVGMVAWGMAGYLFLLPLALFYRFLEEGRAWQWVAFAILLAWGHLVHPYSFVILVVPLLLLYARAWRRLGWRRHLAILAAAVVCLAANLWWIATALRFWHYILDSGFYCQSTASFFFTDYLGLISEPEVTGVIGNKTHFRFLFLAAALLTFYFGRRERDERFLVWAVGLASLLALVYLGGYFWITSQIQPYRFTLPAMFLCVIPAALFVERVVRAGALRRLPALTVAVLGLVAVVSVSALTRDVLYFVPALLPTIRNIPEGEPAVSSRFFGDIGYPKQMEFRHGPIWDDFDDVAHWVQKNDNGQGRILVEWWILGEHLLWRTRAQILGGFLERNLKHTAANLFRRNEEGDLPPKALKRYLEDYAVKWVIITFGKPKLEQHEGLLAPLGTIQNHKVYRTTVPVTYFRENHGLVEPSMNHLKVTGTDPDQDVVLKFHFLETLVCRPGCHLRREPLRDDPVGFIRVSAPHPADFDIVNAY